MSCGSIYKISFPNGKHYIGLTTSLEQRTKDHKHWAKSGSSKYLYNSIRKYNMVDNLELIEIDTADTKDELCEKEIQYIQEYNSYYMNGNGYNMTYGGEGVNGYVYTEEDKQKRSEISKQYFANPEARQKMSEAQKTRFDNPEARQRASEGQKKRFDNPEARQQISEALINRYKDNPEARQKMSEAQKTRYKNNPDAGKEQSERLRRHYENNPEARQQISEAQINRYKDNPEARQQLSEAHKKRFKDNPDAGKEHGERMKKHYENNPEARQQMSERGKKRFENPEARRKILDGKGQNKPFDIFTKEGTFIKTFNYQFEAREYLQKEHHITSTINISKVLLGKRSSSAGFVFKYK